MASASGNGRPEAGIEHVDVLVIGAGISGIGAGCHLEREFPGRSYAVLEARDAIGGTWDLFRYPGIRSDSDMHTLGFRFRPWTEAEAIADGPAILGYLRETAEHYGVDRKIRLGHRVVRAQWSSERGHWTLDIERSDNGSAPLRMTSKYLVSCCGYYRYDRGFIPSFPGRDNYRGTFIHPQEWPEDLDYVGRRVVVIGSGATAVTLVPAMAKQAERVTMLQRSPTYVVALPAEDPIANFLRRWLPERAAYFLTRWKNVLLQAAVYRLSRRRPRLVRKLVRRATKRHLPAGYDVDTHFNPRYDPWDQRMCLVPDGDLFRALAEGSAEIVTDEIETFTERGIALRSGRELEAEIVVSATGLDLLALGGVELVVDGEEVRVPEKLAYKGMMLRGVPNFVFAVGYTNASWTLKVDITCEYLCRLMRHMDEHGFTSATPLNVEADVSEEPFLDFSAGYVLRALDRFPKQGSKRPWRLDQNYARDVPTLRYGRIDDGAMVFSRAGEQAGAASLDSVEGAHRIG
jgi:cation diffusion facilitator CzcD-associated flavoprotein CzcO